MNRTFRNLLTISLLILCAKPLQAQFRLAIEGGVHSSNILQTNSIPGYQNNWGQFYTSKTGFELGILGEIPLGDKQFFLQPGILYTAKGNQFEKIYDTLSVLDTLYNQHTLNLNYVEIPVYFTWKLPITRDGKNKFYLSAGPYLAFIYSVSQSYQNRLKPYNSQQWIYNSGTEDVPVGNSPNAYKTFDIGMAAKTGVELGRVYIGLYYSHGLTNVYSSDYSASFHNQVIGGSVGFWFNAPKTPAQPVIDSDKDGVDDLQDSCKTIPGLPRYHGCPIPDSDLDGINDEADSCKSVPGNFKYHGCPIPDSDLDGINDEEDSCKTVAGTLKYHGCPVPDRDHDGVPDESDKCPDQPGNVENQGCPVVKTALIERAQWVADNVTFNTNSSRLTKSSFPAIRELADTLKSNPDLSLLIQGYTDNVGNPEYNLKLSQERAKVVRKELLKLGVAENRIQVEGFGERNPLAPNDTEAGRAKNRRVVFVFQLKNR